MSPSDRGVLYVVWGSGKDDVLDRSIASLRTHHPDLPVHVERLGEGASLLDKARMADLSPFRETLYLDLDTVVLGNLDFGFQKAGEFGLACCICECPWARRYGGLSGDTVEYNTGVLFFTEKAKDLFSAWREAVRDLDSSILFLMEDGKPARMPLNDQAGFAKAVEDTAYSPFILPLNWNFRPRWHRSWFGPLKVWHDYADVPESLIGHNETQSADDAVVSFSVLNME